MQYAYFEPGIELGVMLDDARNGYHQGACDSDIAELRRVSYIAEQLDKIAPEQAVAALRPYGTWDADELADHEANLSRLLWLACGDVVDNPQTYPCPECDGEEQETEREESDDYSTPCHLCNGSGRVLMP